MKKLLSVLLLSMLCISLVVATQGSIWTSTGSCDSNQGDNQYYAGQTVYIHVENFNANTNSSWNIRTWVDDNEIVIIRGNVQLDENGSVCFPAYTIQAGDSGEYKVSVDGKHKTYHVIEPPMVPEFGPIVGGLTVLGAIGVFFLVRRK